MNRIGDLGLILGVMLIADQFRHAGHGHCDQQGCFHGHTDFNDHHLSAFHWRHGQERTDTLVYLAPPMRWQVQRRVCFLIHAATMVTAGIYMIARNNVLYSLSPVTMMLVVIVGLAT